MTKPFTTSLAIFTFGLGAIAEAQEGQPRIRRVPTPAATSGGGGGPVMPDELEKNISITVKGALNGGAPIHLTLTGCGRQFRTEAVVGTMEVAGQDIPVIATIAFTVRPLGAGYMLNYAIGSRLPVASSVAAPAGAPAPAVNVSFRDVLISGDVRIKPGQTLKVFEAGEQSIELGLVEKD